MNNMKYRMQDYLGLPYSHYHVYFCFVSDFLSGKKEKNLNRLNRLLKNLSLYLFVLSSVYGHYFINRSFFLSWPALMPIYWNKRKRLHKKTIQLPQDSLLTPTWPSFYLFGTPIWPPWHDALLQDCCEQLTHHYFVMHWCTATWMLLTCLLTNFLEWAKLLRMLQLVKGINSTGKRI